MEEKVWDLAVIGAGAAGLMSSLRAREGGLEVLLLDGREKIGAKILMAGGTRCNLTNEVITEKDYESENKNVLARVLRGFTSAQAIDFFRELGVGVVVEAGGKYFPSTHSGRTVLEAFLKAVRENGVVLETGRKVTALSFADGVFLIRGEGFVRRAKNVLLATGGLSYPTTGSDGTGYSLAQAFGHSLILTTPALTPLKSSDEDWKTISGVALDVKLHLILDGKRKASFEGPLLFTHFGLSGPTALNISRHWLRSPREGKLELVANFFPQIPEEKMRDEILKEAQTNPLRTVKTFLSARLPERFCEVFLKKAKVPEKLILNQMDRHLRETLLKNLYHFPFSITDVVGYSKAEATAGGVPLSELDGHTLESRRQPGLFFAGEILDVDGRIGGFNFQWAWSSGVRAAEGVIKRFASSLNKGV